MERKRDRGRRRDGETVRRGGGERWWAGRCMSLWMAIEGGGSVNLGGIALG